MVLLFPLLTFSTISCQKGEEHGYPKVIESLVDEHKKGFSYDFRSVDMYLFNAETVYVFSVFPFSDEVRREDVYNASGSLLGYGTCVDYLGVWNWSYGFERFQTEADLLKQLWTYNEGWK